MFRWDLGFSLKFVSYGFVSVRDVTEYEYIIWNEHKTDNVHIIIDPIDDSLFI